jgi:hypothetical protein
MPATPVLPPDPVPPDPVLPAIAELPAVRPPPVVPPVPFEVPPVAETPPVAVEPPLAELPPLLLEPPVAELPPAAELLLELRLPPEPVLPPLAVWPPEPLPPVEMDPPLPPELRGSLVELEQPANAATVSVAANKNLVVVFIICSMAGAPTFYSLFCNSWPPLLQPWNPAIDAQGGQVGEVIHVRLPAHRRDRRRRFERSPPAGRDGLARSGRR